jgi:hypothetical protein
MQMMQPIDAALSIAIGLGLAAACGFRVFVPLLALSIAGLSGHVHLTPGFAWIATWPALIAFAAATVFEVLAYSVPVVDHFLDLLATPTAVLAGIVVSASVMVDLPPLLRWAVALIAGGGIAGLVQGATVLMRLKSSAATGGLANPAFAAMELVGASTASALAILLPLVCLLVLALVCVVIFRSAGRVAFGRRKVRLERSTRWTAGDPGQWR